VIDAFDGVQLSEVISTWDLQALCGAGGLVVIFWTSRRNQPLQRNGRWIQQVEKVAYLPAGSGGPTPCHQLLPRLKTGQLDACIGIGQTSERRE